jgi:hypothetical protein
VQLRKRQRLWRMWNIIKLEVLCWINLGILKLLLMPQLAQLGNCSQLFTRCIMVSDLRQCPLDTDHGEALTLRFPVGPLLPKHVHPQSFCTYGVQLKNRGRLCPCL